jgi:hypothetical protein
MHLNSLTEKSWSNFKVQPNFIRIWVLELW